MDPQKIWDFCHNYSIWREMTLYGETGRPIYAWRAYRWIRRAGLPAPPWFIEYLDQCAERLVETDPKSPEDVAKAFAMGPTGRKASTNSDQLAAAQNVAALKVMQPDASLEALFGKVSESRNVSESYVRDAYYTWFPKK